MSLQDLIAPYLNRFVILFNENATAKLELSCTEGKVHVNIFHDLGAVNKSLPETPPVKRTAYNEVLKKNIKPSQLNRLHRRAAARAEEVKTNTYNQKKDAEKTLEDAEKATHVSELQKVEAAKANFDIHGLDAKVEETLAIAEFEKAISDNANKMTFDEAEKATTDAEFNEVYPHHHYGYCPHRKCGPFKCTLCCLQFETRLKR